MKEGLNKELKTSEEIKELITLFFGGNKDIIHILEQKENEEILEGLKALNRLRKNVGIAVLDVFPFFGSFTHRLADFLKLSKKHDMTPDVSKKLAWGANVIDLFGDIIPSYWIEAGLQLKADIPRLRKLIEEIIRERREQEKAHYEKNKGKIDPAVKVFLPDKKIKNKNE